MIVSPAGFARLEKSMIRFCGMRSGEAAELTGRLAAQFGCHVPIEGIPYHTEVQLCRSMRALYQSIDQTGLGEKLLDAVLKLRCTMDETAGRFWRCYDLEIDDFRTVYSLCLKSLNPVWEPPVCLLSQMKER